MTSRVGCRASNDVVLLLDVSGSLSDIYDFMTSFARRVIFGLDFQQDRNRLAIVTFSDDVTIEFDLSEYSVTYRSILQQLFFDLSC